MGISHNAQNERFVWGLISDLDLMRAGIRLGPEETAGTLALEPIITVGPSTSLTEAGESMLKHGVSHVVVVDPDTERPTGILSTLEVSRRRESHPPALAEPGVNLRARPLWRRKRLYFLSGSSYTTPPSAFVTHW